MGWLRELTDSAGVAVGTADFAAFGTERATSGADSVFGFAGEQSDPTGLQYLRARYYDPTTGTFLSTDPVTPGAGGVVGYNTYSYVGNNPTTWVDPSGSTSTIERTTTHIPAEIAREPVRRAGRGLLKKFLKILGALALGGCGVGALLSDGFCGAGGEDSDSEGDTGTGTGTDVGAGPVTPTQPEPSEDEEGLPDPPVSTEGRCENTPDHAGGGSVAPVDLYAVGREGGQPFPRNRLPDLKLDSDGVVCPSETDDRGIFFGLSAYASPSDLAAQVSGQVWRLPAGTFLPDLGVEPDGEDFGGLLPTSHHTIYPLRAMTFEETKRLYQGLGWIHGGHTRDFS